MDSKRRAVDDDDEEEESLQSPFSILSEDTISEIISRTSPLDVLRFAVISKGFKLSADSDTAWSRFVPMDIVARSDSPLVYSSLKELYFTVCNSPILFDGGTMSFSLERRTGKRCFMVGARQLAVGGDDGSEDWEWTSDPDSRFSEVAKLKTVNWLDIRAKIHLKMLSRRTFYGAYLVFKLMDRAYGLEFVSGVTKFVNRDTDLDVEDQMIVLHLQRGQAMYRCPAPRQRGLHPITRADGWKEIELGSFFIDSGDEGEVEARLMETWRLNRKSGLIVQGIEFRLKTTPRYIDRWKIR